MSSLFDDVMMGAKVAGVFFKGAKKVGKLAADGIQKVNESEKFQNLKTDIQNRVANSETLNTVKTEVQQRISQITTAQPASAKKYCAQCGARIEAEARFCSNCGAAQEVVTVDEEDAVPADPENCEALPTVLQNDQEKIPDIFDFQPNQTAVIKENAPKQQRTFESRVGKYSEAFTGHYHLDDPSFDLDMHLYQEGELICFAFYDHTNGSRHVYKFDDWGTGKKLLYAIAQDYSFKFIYCEDGRMELDTYGAIPDISGMYCCLD